MHKATDWTRYYKQSPGLSRLTRPITTRYLIQALHRYSVPRPVLAELGGAGSCVMRSVFREIAPSAYHVVDSNEYGLELLRQQAEEYPLVLHHRDVRTLNLETSFDVVFSIGLIEHFDSEGTRQAVLSHLRLLKSGGVAIISFPTPTVLYRATRRLAELFGAWKFPDERPLRTTELQAAVGNAAELLNERLIWPIVLTQAIVVFRKK